jgi:hypothetical protein
MRKGKDPGGPKTSDPPTLIRSSRIGSGTLLFLYQQQQYTGTSSHLLDIYLQEPAVQGAEGGAGQGGAAGAAAAPHRRQQQQLSGQGEQRARAA